MGDREKAADYERECNPDVENGQNRRAPVVAGLAPVVPVVAVFALTAGPEQAQACFLGIPCR